MYPYIYCIFVFYSILLTGPEKVAAIVSPLPSCGQHLTPWDACKPILQDFHHARHEYNDLVYSCTYLRRRRDLSGHPRGGLGQGGGHFGSAVILPAALGSLRFRFQLIYDPDTNH